MQQSCVAPSSPRQPQSTLTELCHLVRPFNKVKYCHKAVKSESARLVSSLHFTHHNTSGLRSYAHAQLNLAILKSGELTKERNRKDCGMVMNQKCFYIIEYFQLYEIECSHVPAPCARRLMISTLHAHPMPSTYAVD